MKPLKASNSSESTHTATPLSNGKQKNDFFSASSQRHKPFFGPSTVQPKLEIGQPDDKYEQEADRVADTVMRMPDPQVQRKPVEEEEKLQKKSNSNETRAGYASSGLSSQLASQAGRGRRLPKAVRSEMSRKMGTDFSGVNVHTGSKAVQMNRQLGAKAFTHGSDIYFNKGEYSPTSGRGKRLLAHELTHVVQQHDISSRLQRDEEEYRPTYEFFNFSGVQQVSANMESRFHQTINYINEARRAGDQVKNKLITLSDEYEDAWNNYADVIRSARMEARNQEQWTNICVGIGAGVLIGLGAAFVFPTAAAGWFALSAGEVVGVVASSGGQAALGAATSYGLTEALSPTGTDLEPEGIRPEVLRMNIWKNISQMYHNATTLVEASRNLHMISIAAEYLSGEIRVHVAGGEPDMDEESVLDMMVELINTDNEMMTRIDPILTSKLDNVRELRSRAEALPTDNGAETDMEQDIWILWMGELDDPSVLDLDEIEDYLHGDINILGSGSVLGVDFGSWTTEEDEEQARNAAHLERNRIRQRFHILSRGIQPDQE